VIQCVDVGWWISDVSGRFWVKSSKTGRFAGLEVWKARPHGTSWVTTVERVSLGSTRHECMAYHRHHHRSRTFETSAKQFYINCAAASTSTASTHTVPYLPRLNRTPKTKPSPCSCVSPLLIIIVTKIVTTTNTYSPCICTTISPHE
jgi:hypothetical protein